MARYREWNLSCKVYVGNLGNNASKHEIEGAFSKYGMLRNVWIARNPPGFAFVEFEDPRDAEDAVRGLDGTRLCGTRVRVEMSTGALDELEAAEEGAAIPDHDHLFGVHIVVRGQEVGHHGGHVQHLETDAIECP